MTAPVRPLRVALASLVLTVLAGTVHAQDRAWRSFVSVSPVFENANLDGGGDVDVAGVILRAGASTAIGDGNRAGVTLNYDYFDYSFDNPAAFGGVAPWNVVQRYGFSVPLSFALRDGWMLGVAPSIDWFRENGAQSGESRVWGATVSAVKRFPDGNLLGLGIAAFDGLEETVVFPYPIVDWKFGSRWRLANPLPAGPTGPAGLELGYEFDTGWTLGVGATWRKTRFRLSADGPTPNGVGQISGVPIFLRASRDFAGSFTLNLYTGVVVAGELRVESASGDLLRKDDFDPAAILGANVTFRF